MIRSFRHRELKRLFEDGDRTRLNPAFVSKIERILLRLDAATVVDDVDAPGFGLHPLRGNLKGWWAVTVNRNWRIIFRFDGEHAIDMDLVDYH
jgi:proteic killer suppression protein